MLLAVLSTSRAGTFKQRIERRLKWSYPEGARVIAEYWLQTPDPQVITFVETDDLAPIMAATSQWDDVFTFRVVPALTAEQGIEMAKRMMS